MRESGIEKSLAREIQKRNGLYFKLGNCGLPDRLVILPGGRHVYIELKRAGGKPDPLQEYQMDKLRRQGCEVYLLEGMDEVRRFLKEVIP